MNAKDELATLMAHGRVIRPAPDVVRARLLVRARATVAAASDSESTSAPAPASLPPRWRGVRLAVAAGLALIAVAAGAAAALHARAPGPGEMIPISIPRPVTPGPTLEPPPTEPAPMPPPRPVSVVRSKRLGHPISPAESYAPELALLQRAQTEYASHEFADALVLVAEHARRFPNGRLAEEREALRVRSLAGAGQGDEARRVLAAFTKRFPHSAFLPRLQPTARSAEE